MGEVVMEKSTTVATAETNKIIAKVRRNSTGIITPRSSLSLSSNGEKVLSRYMGVSIGSCHDLCKYGRKHASEEENHPILPSYLSNNPKSNEKQNLVTSSNLEVKKRLMVKLKSTAPQKTELSDNDKVTEHRTESPSNGMEACEVPDIKKNYASAMNKRMVSLTPKASKQMIPLSFKGSCIGSGPQAIKSKGSAPLEIVGISDRTVITLKANVPPNALGSRSGQSFQNKNMIKSLDMARIEGNKTLKPLIAPLSPQTLAASLSRLSQTKHMNVKSGSPVGIKEVEKPDYDNDGIAEKVLYVIEQEPKSVDVEQLTSSLSNEEEETDKSGFESSEMSESEYEDEETESKKTISKCEDMMRPRRNAAVHPEYNFSPPHKLKFRRGTVLEVQAERDAPRRLRFRKRRVVSENMDDLCEVVRTSYSTTELDSAALMNTHGSEAQSVVLRHQDIDEKKDTQGLFNHVIEETASKLVKTRKSKVQALVGAFETVISLQESKTASAV